MLYSASKSVLVFSDSADLRNLLNGLADNLGLFNVYEADKESDVIAVPCFLFFIDASKLSADLVSFLKEVYADDEFDHAKICIIGDPSDLPESIQKATIFLSESNLNLSTVKNRVYSQLKRFNTLKKRHKQFVEKLQRIISLMDERKPNKSELCKKYGVSISTLNRDFKIIETAYALNEFPVKMDRIVRIVYVHLAIENNHSICKKDICYKFAITERTFHRDIEVLNELGKDKIKFQGEFYA